MTDTEQLPHDNPKPPLWINSGTIVTAREGALAGMSGPLAEDWRGEGNIVVTLSIFGRETRIEFAPQQIFPCPIPREAEWPEGTGLERMLENVVCHASDRKTRLFGVACCRRVAYLMTEPRCAALSADASRLGLWEVIEAPPAAPGFLLQAVADAERFAESGEGREGMQRDARAAWTLYSAREHFYQWIGEGGWGPADQELLATAGAAQAVQLLCENPSPLAVARAASCAVYWASGGTQRDGSDSDEEAAQRQLARDFFGLPLHLRSAEQHWLTPSVRGIADAIDKEWSPGLLPILADALEDAGCTDRSILEHLRSSGPHIRGCWAYDLVVGKS